MNEDFVRITDIDGNVGYINTRYIRAFAEATDGTIFILEQDVKDEHHIQGPLSDFIQALNYHDNKVAT